MVMGGLARVERQQPRSGLDIRRDLARVEVGAGDVLRPVHQLTWFLMPYRVPVGLKSMEFYHAGDSWLS